jgi:phosphatidylinositol alpha-1,6-mannosyltransferase
VPSPQDILVFSEDYPPYPGGIAQWARGVALGLAGAGHSVRVLTRHRDRLAYEPGVPVGTMRGRRWRQLRTWYCYQAVKSLYASGARPDWIFSTTWNFSRGIARLARKRGSRLVTVVHGLEVTRSMSAVKRAWMEKTLLAGDFTVAVSRFTRERTLALARLDPGRVLVFPNGVDASRYRPGVDAAPLRARLGLDGARVILTLARVVERKGHDTVIRALPRVLERVPEAVYVVAGSCDRAHRRRLEALADARGVRGCVRFIGYVDPADTPALYNLCDVYAMPSRELEDRGDTEGFGITFLEAGACGRPVVGGRSGGVAEAVADGESGLLADPLDPEDVAGKLVRILADPGLAERLGGRGRARVLESFTWERIAAALFAAVAGGEAR